MTLKPTNKYWRPRLKGYIWQTFLFGIACLAAGWQMREIYQGSPDTMGWIALGFAAFVTVKKLWEAFYQERK
jgi:hypothetical protein